MHIAIKLIGINSLENDKTVIDFVKKMEELINQ